MIKISMIAAIGENRELGKKHKLLWDIPEDMKLFRELTKGHVVIMGRKTLESIGRLLPKRVNIIITRDKKYKPPFPQNSIDQLVEFYVVNSMEEALEQGKKKETQGEIFIIGGGQIYKEGIKYADKLYLTIVKGKFDADTFFPDYSEFRKVVFKKESRNREYKYTFLALENNS